MGNSPSASRNATAARSWDVSALATSACARHNTPAVTAPASTIGPSLSWRRRTPRDTPAAAHSATRIAPTICVAVGPLAPAATISPPMVSPTATGAARKHHAGFSSDWTETVVGEPSRVADPCGVSSASVTAGVHGLARLRGSIRAGASASASIGFSVQAFVCCGRDVTSRSSGRQASRPPPP